MLGKVFKAYDVRAKVPKPLTSRIAWQIGHGTADLLLEEGRDTGHLDPMSETIVVGRDPRPTSPELRDALTDGLRARGASVIDLGIVDSPMITFAVNYLGCGGGVQVTASHNPLEYNGFKFSRRGGRPIGTGSGLEEIRERAAVADPDAPHAGEGLIEERDLWTPYRDRLLGLLEQELPGGIPAHRRSPVRLVIDASNGSAGAMVPRVFGDLEGLELVRLNFEHQKGEFAHDPNPLVESNLQQLQKAVVRRKADAGICFDGDADRCVLVDERGTTVGGDLLTAWLAPGMLKGRRDAGVVYDLRSSRVLPETIEAAGGRPIPARVGHIFMKQAMHSNAAVFGGELSGHFYYQDMFDADNAARALCSVLAGIARLPGTVSEAIEPLRKYAQSGELNFVNDDIEATLEELREHHEDAQLSEMDGLSIDTGRWWANIRASNTEPLLRLNLEAPDPSTLEVALQELAPLLGRRESN